MFSPDDLFRIGRIGKPHGVKGEVSMHFDDDVFDRTDADYVILDIDGTFVPFFFEEYRFRNDATALVKFTDIDSTDEARALTGSEVYFERSKSPSSDDGELSWAELVGFKIKDSLSGRLIGTISEVDLSTINTLFSVTTQEGNEVLIPVADEFIIDVNGPSREISVSLPEGLLELF